MFAMSERGMGYVEQIFARFTLRWAMAAWCYYYYNSNSRFETK